MRRPELEFELAARLRDRLASVKRAIEKQQIAGTRNEDFDVIGIGDDELEAAVQLFFVRKGRVMGQRGFVVDKVEELDGPAARRPCALGAVPRREPAGLAQGGARADAPARGGGV